MRLIAIIIMLLPITAVLGEDQSVSLLSDASANDQINIPRSVERYFNKSISDNQKAVETVAQQIEKRNQELRHNIEEMVKRNNALKDANEKYNLLIDSMQLSNEQILDSNAKQEIKTMAAIYMRLDEEMAKTPSDYLPNDNSAINVKQNDIEIILTNTWQSGNWTDNFKPDGSVVINGDISDKKWEVDGNTVVVKRADGSIEQIWSLKDDGTVYMTRTNGSPMVWTKVEVEQ